MCLCGCNLIWCIRQWSLIQETQHSHMNVYCHSILYLVPLQFHDTVCRPIVCVRVCVYAYMFVHVCASKHLDMLVSVFRNLCGSGYNWCMHILVILKWLWSGTLGTLTQLSTHCLQVPCFLDYETVHFTIEKVFIVEAHLLSLKLSWSWKFTCKCKVLKWWFSLYICKEETKAQITYLLNDILVYKIQYTITIIITNYRIALMWLQPHIY